MAALSAFVWAPQTPFRRGGWLDWLFLVGSWWSLNRPLRLEEEAKPPKVDLKYGGFLDEIMGLLRDNDGGEESRDKALFLGGVALRGWAVRFPCMTCVLCCFF